MHSAYFSGELCSISLRVKDLHNLVFCMGNLSLLSIYLFLQSFISVWTHGYSFCTLSYNLMLLYLFVAQVVPALAIGSSSVCSCFPMMYPHHCGFFFLYLFLSTFLFSDSTRCSRLVLHMSWPSSRMSVLCFFLTELYSVILSVLFLFF